MSPTPTQAQTGRCGPWPINVDSRRQSVAAAAAVHVLGSWQLGPTGVTIDRTIPPLSTRIHWSPLLSPALQAA